MSLITRVKSPEWKGNDELAASDLVAEFDNIVNVLRGAGDIKVINFECTGGTTLGNDNTDSHTVNGTLVIQDTLMLGTSNIADLLVPIGTIIPFYDFGGALTFNANVWAYCNGAVNVNVGGTLRTMPDMANRYLVGFGTAALGSITTLSATPTAGGTGYAVGDVLTIITGNGDATCYVNTVNADASNAVTEVLLYANGSGYSTGSGQATSGGTGSDCTVDVTAVAAASDHDTTTWATAAVGAASHQVDLGHTHGPGTLRFAVANTSTTNIKFYNSGGTLTTVSPSLSSDYYASYPAGASRGFNTNNFVAGTWYSSTGSGATAEETTLHSKSIQPCSIRVRWLMRIT